MQRARPAHVTAVITGSNQQQGEWSQASTLTTAPAINSNLVYEHDNNNNGRPTTLQLRRPYYKDSELDIAYFIKAQWHLFS